MRSVYIKAVLTLLLPIMMILLPFNKVSGESTAQPCGMLPIEEEVLSEAQLKKLIPKSTAYGYANTDRAQFPVSNVYVSQLSSEERSLYDRICNEYEKLYYSSADVPDQRFVSLSYDGSVISRTDLRKIYYTFYYTNPRYFYAYNGYSVSTSEDTPCIALKIYKDFMSGDIRSQVRDGIEQKASEWLEHINSLETDLEKELYISERLCASVVYNERAPLNQSLAGAMYYGECVCNGYAMAVNYMCNLAGIEAFTVISRDHAWNAVDLYGTFFQLDTTWIDSTSNASRWTNKSIETFRQQDPSGSHMIDMTHFSEMTLPPMDTDDTHDSIILSDTAFPDSSLKNALSSMLDRDGSGGLCLNEYAFAENTDLSDKNIRSLKGISAIPSVRRLNCSYNPLFSADISGTALTEESFICRGSVVSVSSSEIPMPDEFDFARASGWNGGTPDTSNRMLTADSGRISYEYDCGSGIKRQFAVRINTAKSPVESIAESISFGFAEGENSNEISADIYSGESLYSILTKQGKSLWKKDAGSFVDAMYMALLGRFPDKAGLAHWEDRISSGCSMEYIIRGFLDSAEFRLQTAVTGFTYPVFPESLSHAQITHAEFTAAVYKGFLGRAPDQSEIYLWEDIPPENIVTGVLCSEEYALSPLSSSELADRLYLVLLDRDPDPQGYLHWLNILDDKGLAETVRHFIEAEEFMQRMSCIS